MTQRRNPIHRRRYHKFDKRYNAAILDHEHNWEGEEFLRCQCGASAKEENGKIVDIIEARTKRLSGYPAEMFSQ